MNRDVPGSSFGLPREQFFELSPDACFIIDAQSAQVLDANPAAWKHLGYSQEEMLRLHLWDFSLRVKDAATWERAKQRIIASPDQPFESAHRCRDGRWLPVEISARYIDNSDGHYFAAIARDISRRKQAEGQLALQALVLDQIQDHVTVTDLEGRILYVNQAELAGIGHRKEDILGRHVEAYGDDPESVATQQELVQKTLEQGNWQGEIYNQTSDGQRILLDLRTTLVRDDQGQPLGLVGIGTDITQRKQDELARRDYQARFEEFFQHTSDGVAIYRAVDDGADFVFAAFNPAGERIGQIAPGTAIGRRVSEVFPGIADMGLLDVLRRVWRSGEAERLPINHYQDGRIGLWVENYVFRLQNGEVVAVHSDISERKRAEEALRESEARFRKIFERTDAISVQGYDRERRVIYWNAASQRLYGYSAEEALGRQLEDLIIPDAMRDGVIAITSAWADGGPAIPSSELQLRRADGSPATVFSSHVMLHNSRGEPEMYCIDVDLSDRKRTEDALRESEAKFRRLAENLGRDYVFYRHDHQGQFTYLSPSVSEMLGWTWDELASGYSALLADHPANAMLQHLTNLALGGERQPPYLMLANHKEGGVRWLELTEWPVTDDNGRVVEIEGLAHDITGRLQAEDQLRLSASVFSHAREGIFITDAEGIILDVNQAFCRITGYGQDEVIGRKPSLLKSGHHTAAFYSEIWRSLSENGHWSGEIWNRRKDGSLYAELLTISAVEDESGQIRHYVALFSDITVQKEQLQQLQHFAHYDPLTNLPNRTLLADRLQQAMAQGVRRGKQLAVLYLDIDGFKEVNDAHGHDTGDLLLISLAQRMKGVLREGDTIARLGGDEFVAVLIDLARQTEAVPLVERLLETASRSVDIKDLVLQVSVSIGITFYPQHADIDGEQLLRQADQAMYQAKQAGKNRYQVFDAGPSTAPSR